MDIYIGLALMTLSAVFFGLTFQFPKQTLAMPPTLFPRIICLGLFIMATILFWQGWKKRTLRSEIVKESAFPWGRFLAMIILAFVYTRVLELVSYILATPFLIAGLMIIFYEKRWLRITTVSLTATFVIYIIFRIFFKVPLPRFELF
ncbi:MAG: tripartite tricarboxylate transporter TctB family protein [Thermodesulfobacteriota bacterium]